MENLVKKIKKKTWGLTKLTIASILALNLVTIVKVIEEEGLRKNINFKWKYEVNNKNKEIYFLNMLSTPARTWPYYIYNLNFDLLNESRSGSKGCPYVPYKR